VVKVNLKTIGKEKNSPDLLSVFVQQTQGHCLDTAGVTGSIPVAPTRHFIYLALIEVDNYKTFNILSLINNMLITDFNKSSIGWFGESSGKFQLVSTLTYYNNFNKKVIYGLGQSVLAGNVYSKKNLIKNPYYIFQVLGNQDEQKILRTDLSNHRYDYSNSLKKRKKLNDTKLSKIFKDFRLEIKKQKGIKIISFKNLYKYFKNNEFVSKIKFKKFQNLNFEIEFPINHLNISFIEKKWQAETGPILIPMNNKKNSKLDFFPSFVIFNKFDSADIFYDYPFGFRKTKKSYLKNINCEIEIYSLLNNNSLPE
tara:strand:- start:375 stop:1307 length:933 start_codon:yes stop_codon:yes gene_type:complete